MKTTSPYTVEKKKKSKAMGSGLILVLGMLIAIGVFALMVHEKKEASTTKDGLILIVERNPENEGWMYSIYARKNILVRQKIMPIVNGKQPIPNKKTAEALGALVLQKIRNEQLPVLTKSELDYVMEVSQQEDSKL
ncbi:MAG: DUF4907 domain-containing protein [Bacteroidota bacterium]